MFSGELWVNYMYTTFDLEGIDVLSEIVKGPDGGLFTYCFTKMVTNLGAPHSET